MSNKNEIAELAKLLDISNRVSQASVLELIIQLRSSLDPVYDMLITACDIKIATQKLLDLTEELQEKVNVWNKINHLEEIEEARAKEAKND